jgi:threonine dehydratase
MGHHFSDAGEMTMNPRLPALREMIRPTTFLESLRLNARLGTRLILASETFQYTGSFKYRAACNVAIHVPHPHLITASSGNFGQALACACRQLGKSCTVVMPGTSARVKVDAVREFGGVVDLIDVRAISRRDRVTELAHLNPAAYVASAYDDPLVIAGNATLGEELAAPDPPMDLIIAPVGGGGLTSGLITGLRARGRPIPVFGAEPVLANDAARSLRAGRIISNEVEPQTIADGVRTVSVGQHNWAVLREGLAGIIEVSEEHIREAVRLLFTLANLKAEPTGALAVAAVLAAPAQFRDRAVGCVVSGGNVDAEVFREILA